MALILCLETSSKNCSVSIAKNGKTIQLKELLDDNYCHGEKLHVLIEELLKESKFLIRDFDAFAFSSGPGSYTGLRIGAAAIKGFAFALDKPVISVSTLNSMVYGLYYNSNINISSYDLFCPVLDSRKGEVYMAIFSDPSKQILKPFACVLNEFPFSKYIDKNKVCFFGPGKYKIESVIKHQNAYFLHSDYPTARHMGVIAEEKYKKNNFVDTAYFEPLYLKDFILTQSKK